MKMEILREKSKSFNDLSFIICSYDVESCDQENCSANQAADITCNEAG